MQADTQQTITPQDTPQMRFTKTQLQTMSESSLLKFVLAYLAYMSPCINEVDELARITGISVSALNQYKRGGQNSGSVGAQAWQKIYKATKFELIAEWHTANKIGG